MDLKKILLFGCLLFSVVTFADCPRLDKKTMVENGIKHADIIFYGKIIATDSINETYTFRIIELFKGKWKSKTIFGKTSDSNCTFPRKGTSWIVYSKLLKDNTIDISECSPSQSMQGYGMPPPPPLINRDLNKPEEFLELQDSLVWAKAESENLRTFLYQLDKLRLYKLAQNTITDEMKTDLNRKILMGSLLANGILLLTIIVIIVSKKTSNNRITK